MKFADLVRAAGSLAEKVQSVQSIVPIGLGDTMADILAVSIIVQDDRDVTDVSTGMLAHSLVRWWRGGLPRFRLTHGLTTKLMLTDADGIESSDLKLPFPTYLIELPIPNCPLVFDDDEQTKNGSDVGFVVVSRYVASVDEMVVDRGHLQRALSDLWQRSRSTTFDKPQLRMFVVGARQGMVIDDCKPLWGAFDDRPDARLPSVTSRDRRCVEAAWRLAVNLPLYLHHVPSSRGSGGKVVNLDHGVTSLFYEIGQDIKIDPHLREAARAFCVSGSRPEGWTLAKRFIVRGHWKQQPCGSGRSERRMTFIEPYWKGPADAPALARAYTDEGTKIDG